MLRPLLQLALLLPSCALNLWAQQATADLQALISRARAEQMRGDLGAAARDYAVAAHAQPHAVEWLTNLGLVQYEMKAYAASAGTLRPIASAHHDEFVSHLFLGLDLLALHQPAEAIGPLEAAAKLRAADTQAPLALARAYAGTHRYNQAIMAYRRARGGSPADSDIFFETGMTYLNNVEQRSRQLLDFSAANPAFVRVLLADALMDQHRYNEAKKIYTEAEADTSLPKQLCVPARTGFALFGSGDVAAALTTWRAEAARQGQCTLCSLALLASAPGDQTAETKASTQKLPSPIPAMDVAWALRVLPKEAAATLTQSLQKHGMAWPSLNMARADALYPSVPFAAADNSASGITGADALLKACPINITTARSRSSTVAQVLALVAEGKLADAAACADAALERTPKQPELLFWSIRIDEQLASEALQLFQASAPDAPRTHLLLGDMERQRGDLLAAEEQYRSVLQGEPGNLVAAVGLAIALLHDGKADEAIARAHAVLAEDPSSAAANQVLGEALVTKHDFVGAEPALRAALAHDAAEPAHLHALLGRAEAGLGHTASAIGELELGAPSDFDGSVHFQLSRLYRQTGNQEAARKAATASANLARNRMDRGLLETADRASSQDAAQP